MKHKTKEIFRPKSLWDLIIHQELNMEQLMKNSYKKLGSRLSGDKARKLTKNAVMKYNEHDLQKQNI